MNITNEQKEIEMWHGLSDEEKLKRHMLIYKLNSFRAEKLREIEKYLLGDDYYTIACDQYGSEEEAIAAIKYHYPNENYSLHRTISKIKNAVKEYIHNGV